MIKTLLLPLQDLPLNFNSGLQDKNAEQPHREVGGEISHEERNYVKVFVMPRVVEIVFVRLSTGNDDCCSAHDL